MPELKGPIVQMVSTSFCHESLIACPSAKCLPARAPKFRRMRHSYPSTPYPASHYDDQMCLKPPLLLWVAVLYLSRAVTLPVAMAIGHFAGVDASAITMFRGIWSVDDVIPSMIAALMLYTCVDASPRHPRGCAGSGLAGISSLPRPLSWIEPYWR
jgi:hypothetical protein